MKYQFLVLLLIIVGADCYVYDSLLSLRSQHRCIPSVNISCDCVFPNVKLTGGIVSYEVVDVRQTVICGQCPLHTTYNNQTFTCALPQCPAPVGLEIGACDCTHPIQRFYNSTSRQFECMNGRLSVSEQVPDGEIREGADNPVRCNQLGGSIGFFGICYKKTLDPLWYSFMISANVHDGFGSLNPSYGWRCYSDKSFKPNATNRGFEKLFKPDIIGGILIPEWMTTNPGDERYGWYPYMNKFYDYADEASYFADQSNYRTFAFYGSLTGICYCDAKNMYITSELSSNGVGHVPGTERCTCPNSLPHPVWVEENNQYECSNCPGSSTYSWITNACTFPSNATRVTIDFLLPLDASLINAEMKRNITLEISRLLGIPVNQMIITLSPGSIIVTVQIIILSDPITNSTQFIAEQASLTHLVATIPQLLASVSNSTQYTYLQIITVYQTSSSNAFTDTMMYATFAGIFSLLIISFLIYKKCMTMCAQNKAYSPLELNPLVSTKA